MAFRTYIENENKWKIQINTNENFRFRNGCIFKEYPKKERPTLMNGINLILNVVLVSCRLSCCRPNRMGVRV